MIASSLHSETLFTTSHGVTKVSPGIARNIEDTSMPPLIMIIDDSYTVCKIVETCLKREGYDCISFNNGVEALRWFTNPSVRFPMLLFLDIEMPKISGYTLARLLKSKSPFEKTPIVMLTRRNGALDRVKAQLVGAKAYITKPFKTQDILTVVHTYLGNTPSSCN